MKLCKEPFCITSNMITGPIVPGAFRCQRTWSQTSWYFHHRQSFSDNGMHTLGKWYMLSHSPTISLYKGHNPYSFKPFFQYITAQLQLSYYRSNLCFPYLTILNFFILTFHLVKLCVYYLSYKYFTPAFSSSWFVVVRFHVTILSQSFIWLHYITQTDPWHVLPGWIYHTVGFYVVSLILDQKLDISTYFGF